MIVVIKHGNIQADYESICPNFNCVFRYTNEDLIIFKCENENIRVITCPDCRQPFIINRKDK